MDDINVDQMAAGLIAGLDDNSQPPFPETTMRSLIQNYQMDKQQETMAQQQQQAQANKKQAEEFLASNGKKEGVHTTSSGLEYQVEKEGTGVSPTADDTVSVNYIGTLPDGTKFDSSYDRGQPAEFPLNRVIKGWTEGVQLMKVGAKYKFWVPAELAYGNNPPTGSSIEPGQMLIFEIELLDVH